MTEVELRSQELREKLTLAVYRKSEFDIDRAEAFDAELCFALGIDDDGFPPFLHEAMAGLR